MKASYLIFFLIFSVMANTTVASQTKRYEFKVFLDDMEIGHHHFKVSSNNEQTYINSDARFDVKFLFITAYTYLHSNSETWRNDCLQTINSSTDDNGDEQFVRGEYKQSAFLVKTPDGNKQLDGCVRSFAYWEPELLSSKKLLNVQTGEHVDVDIQSLGVSTITVRGIAVEANHYRLNNEKFSIDLWYSRNKEWLALESTTESGARLRYLVK